MKDKILNFDELSTIRERHNNKKIVHCHGVFDLLHYGHLLHLKSAKKFGDVLVVTLTPDEYVNKGPGRPRFSVQKRAEMLAALQIVDYVVINKFPKATEPIKKLMPDFYVKGPDYWDKKKDITSGIYEEEAAVNSIGGRLVFTNDEIESASSLINAYFRQWDKEQAKIISEVKRKVSLDQMLHIINQMEELRVLVIGEPIVDTYIFCQPENLSSKSPSVSAKYIREENYAGGALAIARHLDSLGCEVELMFTHGGEEYFQNLLGAFQKETNVKVKTYTIKSLPTPHKTRFVDPFQVQRMFEIIDLGSNQWKQNDAQPFINMVSKSMQNVDVVILADFGHGLFEDEFLKFTECISRFTTLNVQTNSGNYGFNLFNKHSHFNYISIDERETRLGMHDRFTPIRELAESTVRYKIKLPTSITLGGAGSIFFEENSKAVFCPSFFRQVVDTTGAGDAYFAITSLLVKLDVPPILVPFIGNLFAGLQTRIIGNKYAVSKVDLIRTINSILA